MNHKENTIYKTRIQSIDLLRGIVIVLMALDHVRDFFGAYTYNAQDIVHITPALFMTRWITNLCAPTFMFLSGLSAYLYYLKTSRRETSLFLLKRGLFLVLLEITIVGYSWKFQFNSDIFLQVIWVLGVSMITLAGFIWLPRKIILSLSIAIIVVHNLFDNFSPDASSGFSLLWHFLHIPFDFQLQGFTIDVVYPLLPWPAVMALGFCLGHWMQEPVDIRNKNFMLLGIFLLGLFIMLRVIDQYGDTYHWQQTDDVIKTALSFIKVTKYPPSLFYVLINLGIVTALWPLLERWKGFGSQFVLCFGKAALFFYLLHLPLIHLLATLYSNLILHAPDGWWHESSFPPLYHFSLMRVYIVWIIVVLGSYPLCLWYIKFKGANQYWWLKYI